MDTLPLTKHLLVYYLYKVDPGILTDYTFLLHLDTELWALSSWYKILLRYQSWRQ